MTATEKLLNLDIDQTSYTPYNPFVLGMEHLLVLIGNMYQSINQSLLFSIATKWKKYLHSQMIVVKIVVSGESAELHWTERCWTISLFRVSPEWNDLVYSSGSANWFTSTVGCQFVRKRCDRNYSCLTLSSDGPSTVLVVFGSVCGSLSRSENCLLRGGELGLAKGPGEQRA